MTTGAVAYMHGYYLGGYILSLGFIITTSGMALWLRDIVTEATIPTNFNNILLKTKLKNKNISLINDKLKYNLLNIFSKFYFFLFKFNKTVFLIEVFLMILL
jgi:hypothetical protein